MRRLRRLAAAAVLAAFAVAGCSVSVGGSMSQSALEGELPGEIEAQVGQAPEAVDCDGGLEGEEGFEQQCIVTLGAEELDLTATVTEVDDDSVFYEWEIPPQ